MIDDLALVLLLVTALLGLFWILFIELPKLNVDQTRDRLFKVRARLFDEAAKGNISFESDAYKISRLTLNGMIRNIEEFSLFGLFSLKFILKKKGISGASGISDALIKAKEKESPEARKLIDDTFARAHRILGVYLIKGSPVFVNLLVLLAAVKAVNNLITKIARKFIESSKVSEPIHAFDSRAYLIGRMKHSRFLESEGEYV